MYNNLDMNKKDLQKLVREAIQEVINEDQTTDKKAQDAAKQAEIAKLTALQKQKQELSKPASADEKPAQDAQKIAVDKEITQTTKKIQRLNKPGLSSLDLDEMANVAVRYELAPDAAAADFAGKKARIVSAMQATEEPMSKMDVAGALGYDKQNPINADFMALVADGVIVPSGAQAAPRLNRPAAEPAGEEVPAGEEGPEGGVAGEMSDEEIEASFAKAMGSGDEEPEAGEIETGGISAASMSDEDYEAFMQYTDLESRLAKVKSDILKTKRSRRDVGDIADQPSSDIENLRNLKDRLQSKMNDLLASSEYLRKRQSKITGKPIEEPKVDDEETLDEWMKGRMQYYAGIKK